MGVAPRTCHVFSHVFSLIFWRDSVASLEHMETQALSEVVALPVTAGAAQTEGDGEEEEEQSEAVINEEDGEPATGIGHGPVATLSQSTLVAYRTGPVLPNLAKAALERLQKRNAGAELEDSPDSDFQPLKRRRLDENADSAEGEENEEVYI